MVKKIYRKQIKPFFKKDMINIIVFPKQVKYITISFVAGLTKKFRSMYTEENFINHIIFETAELDTTNLIKKIKDSIEFCYPIKNKENKNDKN